MKTLVVSLVLFAGTAFAVDAGQAPLRGYTPEHSATEVQWEQKFRELPDPAAIARKHAPPLRAPAPCRLALRQGQRRMASGAAQVLRSRREDRDSSTRSSPRPSRASSSCSAPTKFTAKLQEPALADRSHLRPEERAAPHLQRLLQRWRCHRAARLRELRRARRLRAARRAWASPSKAPSSSRATARPGAASSPKSPPNTAPSAASSTPTRKDDGYSTATPTPTAPCVPQTACSAAASWICRSIPAIRRPPASARSPAQSSSRSIRSRPSPRFPSCPSPTPTRSRF